MGGTRSNRAEQDGTGWSKVEQGWDKVEQEQSGTRLNKVEQEWNKWNMGGTAAPKCCESYPNLIEVL